MLKMITPHGVAKLRELMNDSALDILYYMSPKFGPEVSAVVVAAAATLKEALVFILLFASAIACYMYMLHYISASLSISAKRTPIALLTEMCSHSL